MESRAELRFCMGNLVDERFMEQGRGWLADVRCDDCPLWGSIHCGSTILHLSSYCIEHIVA